MPLQLGRIELVRGKLVLVLSQEKSSDLLEGENWLPPLSENATHYGEKGRRVSVLHATRYFRISYLASHQQNGRSKWGREGGNLLDSTL